MSYTSTILKGGVNVLGAGLAFTVGAELCSWGGEKAKNAANKRFLANEEVDGTVGAVFQKGISLLYSIGHYAEKSGSLLKRINPLFSSKERDEVMQIIKRDDLLGLKRFFSKLSRENKKDLLGLMLVFLPDKGAFHCLQYLLAQGVDIDSRDKNQWTPLHSASCAGCAKIVEYLVSQGAYVDARKKNDMTPLFLASLAGHEKVVEYLVSHGADVNAPAENGLTPLHVAVAEGHAKIVEYLVSHGADVNARVDGLTPLEIALYKKHNQVVNILKEAKNLDLTRMVDGETILHRDIRLEEKEVAKEIIALENNGINLPNGENGATPLHLAVASGDEELAEALLKRGALAGKRDDFGQTPMHIAAMKRDFVMVQLLWNHWGRLDIPDLEGKTPMDRAKERSPYAPIYGSSSKEMTNLQTETLEKPWLDLHCQQRDEKGKVIKDSNDKPIEFDFVVDRLTSDMYEKVQSPWQVRSKALLTFLATPFYLPLSIGKQLAGVVLDLGKIAKQVFEDVAKQIKSRKFLAGLSAITITPIKNAAYAIGLRIWQIASVPLYSIGMLYAALYTQVDQLNGRKMMNKMAEGWNETGFLRIMGLAKLGNAAESERGGLRQFV